MRPWTSGFYLFVAMSSASPHKLCLITICGTNKCKKIEVLKVNTIYLTFLQIKEAGSCLLGTTEVLYMCSSLWRELLFLSSPKRDNQSIGIVKNNRNTRSLQKAYCSPSKWSVAAGSLDICMAFTYF